MKLIKKDYLNPSLFVFRTVFSPELTQCPPVVLILQAYPWAHLSVALLSHS